MYLKHNGNYRHNILTLRIHTLSPSLAFVHLSLILQVLREGYCDGFVQSIKLWSQKSSLLGKHISEITHSRIELRLLSGGRFVATDEMENRGTVRHGDYCEGSVTIIKGSGSVNSSERQTSFKTVRSFLRQFSSC